MKKYTKQILALLLAICALVTYAMPAVFATGNTGAGEAAEAQPVVYDFYGNRGNTAFREEAAGIKAAYDAGTLNWRYEAANTAYQFKPGGSNEFLTSVDSLQYYTSTSTAKATSFIAMRIQSPGAGKYDLTLTHGGRSNGFRNAKVYILDAAAIDAALGANAKTYADAMADPYTAGTDVYTAFNTAVVDALTDATAVMDVNYRTDAYTKGLTAEGSFVFKAEKEYVVVFATGIDPESSVGSILINSLTATYSAEQPAPEETLPEEDLITYDFYGNRGNVAFRGEAAGIKAAYEAGTSNWRYEAANTAYQFKPGGSNEYLSSVDSLQYFTSTSTYKTTCFIAFRIQSPGAGKYDLTLTHGGRSNGVKNGLVYFVDAAVIDAALGANAKAYADAMADPYTAGTEAYTDFYNAITDAITGKTAAINVNYYAATYTKGMTAEGSFVFEADKEYVAVFVAGSDPDADTGSILINSLTAAYSAEQPEIVISEDYIFYTNALKNQSVRENVAGIKAAFDAGTSNWRIEITDNPYQFRLPSDPAGNGGSGANSFESVTASLKYYTGSSVSARTSYLAVRIKSPGAGNFDLTLTHGADKSGAERGNVYIVDADQLDAALGGKASAYGEALAQDLFQDGNWQTGIYSEYQAFIKPFVKNNKAVIKDVNYYKTSPTTGLTKTGRFAFEEGKEYIVIFTSDVEGPTAGTLFVSALNATYSDDQSPIPDEPVGPQEPEYVDGIYDFYTGRYSGSTLADGMEDIAAKYDANVLNWKVEAVGGGLNLSKASYFSNMSSLKVLAAKDWWLAMRIKAPAQDGAYDIQMTHGAQGEGAPSGSIYVIPGDTATKDIFKVAYQTGAAMQADWYYGESNANAIGGRTTTTGSVNLKAGQEYIVVFLPTDASPKNGNACFYLGQLQVTRTGDYVENSGGGTTNSDAVYYEFYDWDHPGHFLKHYKTEEQLGKLILEEEIAEKYAKGEINWCYQQSNGFASFSTGTPYLSMTIGENDYFVFRIKSPGTGTYEITYNHFAMRDKSAGVGGLYILPYEEGMDYLTIRDEANFKEAIVETNYYADKFTYQQSVGKYTAFQEGKEYLVCINVGDNDITTSRSMNCFPQSLSMKRIGDYVAEAGQGGYNGILYDLSPDQYANMWLTRRDGEEYAVDKIAAAYAAGNSNWNFEAINGSAYFTSKYLRVGLDAKGSAMGIRIKAPGTGTYKITLNYILGYEANSANSCEFYILEAPKDAMDSAELANRLAKAPLMEFTSSHDGSRFKRVSANSSYGFQEGKEYIIAFYGADASDLKNTSGSTYMYVENLVMQRTGDYVEPEQTASRGGVALEDVVKSFNTNYETSISNVNGHDYIAISTYGGTMMIYDIDEWRLVDEVMTEIHTPRGSAVDNNGNFWIGGYGQTLYCYNPYTGEGFNTERISQLGSTFSMSLGEDGYLYFGGDRDASIFRFNPETQEYTRFRQPVSWGVYSYAIIQKGDYMYAAISGQDHHEIVMMNKYTGKVIKTQDVTSQVRQRYMEALSFVSDDVILAMVDTGIAAFKTETLERISAEEFGVNGPVNMYASNPKDGKSYFTSRTEGLCCYDSELGKAYPLGGDLKSGINMIRSNQNSWATIDDSRLPGECLVTYGGMSDSGVSLMAYNVVDNVKVELIGLIDPGFGYGQEIRCIANGLPGSNEIYIGTMYGAPIGVYSTVTGEYVRGIKSNFQTDSMLVYNGKMYAGEYTSCCITRLDDGQATMLFQLNDDYFNQARIHKLAAGDEKIFAGTIPDIYRHGGVIVWYDMETELTYVATGPKPEDVYYAKASQIMATKEWYRVTNDELVDFTKEWDADQDSDGKKESFLGFIPTQSIVDLYYRDGLLYGTSIVEGGSSTTNPAETSAQIFVYDVENFKLLKTIDIRDYFTGFPKRIGCIDAIAPDPDISNKHWLLISETLFSMTYDVDTGKVSFTKELSFDMDTINESKAWFAEAFAFEGDYIYVPFGKMGGLCKVNRKDTSDYVQIMSDFETVDQIPRTLLMAEDGNIYYIGGTNIYVINPDPTEEELAQAKAVQDAIASISDTVTLDDRDAIFAIREAVDNLHPGLHPYVNNIDRLSEAEVDLLRLRVNNLGDVTIEDEAELKSIQQTYISLELKQRVTIDYQVVSAAVSKMSVLRAERTTNLIASIGEVVLEKEQLIRDARASFMDLNRYERKLVTNEDVLNVAEAQLTSLLLRKSEGSAVDKLIEKIGFVFFGDGAKISAARKAYNKLDDATKEWVTKYGTLVFAEIILVAEYLIAAAAVTCGVLYTIPATRAKIFKKKEEVSE